MTSAQDILKIVDSLFRLKIAQNKVNFKNIEQYDEFFVKTFTGVIKNAEIALPEIDIQCEFEDELDDLKNELYKEFCPKFSGSSARLLQIIAPEHQEWLNAKKPKLSHSQWNAFSNYLLNCKHFTEESLKPIDDISEKIIDLLEDPTKKENIKVKGLLMGEVQSGKTNTFTAVCHKAIDVGWKFIIILAGMTNDLRVQTQKRMNSDLIGETLSSKAKEQFCGIKSFSKEYQKSSVVFWNLTTTEDDFVQTQKSDKLEDRDNHVAIAICKKNSGILNNLISWLGGDENSDINLDRKKIAKQMPCLIIDDESDQASINSNKDDEEATAVNTAIRTLTEFFDKSAYLAITATPFANIFINPQLDLYLKDNPTTDKLPDLYPKNFILVKPSPDNYVGVVQLFGDGDNEDNYNKLQEQVVIPINHEDANEIFATPLKKDSVIDKLPPSLIEAIRYFVCCCAMKEFLHDDHCTMLIHVDFRKNNHKSISELVSEFIENETNSIKLEKGFDAYELENSETFKAYQKIWNEGCQRKQHKEDAPKFIDITKKNFLEVWRKYLFKAIEKIRLETINSDNDGEKLSSIYENHKNTKLIAVGGYALARGITLEGLCVTYLCRKSSSIDTLLQMGRFFGYRENCIDYMKIWMTKTIEEMFEEAAQAQIEFVNQVQEMNDSPNANPLTFGFKIKKAPTYLKLRIAAANKMRHSQDVTLDINIPGHALQSSKLPMRVEDLDNNIQEIKKFLSKIGEPRPEIIGKNTIEHGYNKDIVWNNVDPEKIATLIDNFNAYGWGDVNKQSISKYIRDKLLNERWQVRVISKNRGNDKAEDVFGISRKIGKAAGKLRIKKQDNCQYFYFSKGSIMSGDDLGRCLSKDDYVELCEICKIMNPEKKSITAPDILTKLDDGVIPCQLLIYSLDPSFEEDNEINRETYKDKICGLVIGIPRNKDTKDKELTVKYSINDIYALNLNNEYSEY